MSAISPAMELMDGILTKPKTTLVYCVVFEMDMEISSLFYSYTYSGYGTVLTLFFGLPYATSSTHSVNSRQRVSITL
jgi:ABC-type spermidine/putrescine transport system permease subunit I